MPSDIKHKNVLSSPFHSYVLCSAAVGVGDDASPAGLPGRV